MMEEKIKNIYTTPSNPACFSSIDRVYQQAKKEKIEGITRSIVKNVLHSLPAYTFHFARRWHFPRRKVIVFNIDDIWAVDLIFFDQLGRWNKGYKYCLTIIDIMSGYNWVEPIKNKNTKLVRDSFLSVLKRAFPRKPKKYLVIMEWSF